MTGRPIIYLVDDDDAVRKSLSIALGMADYEVQAFGAAEAFLEACRPGQHGCVVLDLKMPDMDGLELQQALKERGCHIPVIFISGDGTIPASVAAVKEGALDFLEKPFSVEALTDRIEEALAADRERRESQAETARLQALYGQLSRREREVMRLATEGLTNKEIGAVLGISPRTVENHRARVMDKMQAGNIAELCHIAASCLETGNGDIP